MISDLTAGAFWVRYDINVSGESVDPSHVMNTDLHRKLTDLINSGDIFTVIGGFN